MRTFVTAVVLVLLSSSGAFAALYDNTTTDTLETLFYSVGPYAGIGDQIELARAGSAESAQLQFFNAGGPGTFDAELRFYEVGAPVGAQIGPAFTVGAESDGLDIVTLFFDLDFLLLPQQVVFVAGVKNSSNGMDLGVNLFEPPTVGLSDNTFLIVDTGAFSQEVSSNQNVYFQVIEAVPEPSVISLSAIGLLAIGIFRRMRAA